MNFIEAEVYYTLQEPDGNTITGTARVSAVASCYVVNLPLREVVSGAPKALRRLVATLQREGLFIEGDNGLPEWIAPHQIERVRIRS